MEPFMDLIVYWDLRLYLIHKLSVESPVLGGILLNDISHIWVLNKKLIHVVFGQGIKQAFCHGHSFAFSGLIKDHFIVTKMFSIFA